MTTVLEVLDLIGRATWAPVWVPLLAWTGMVFPLWALLRRTDRLHPHVEYRLSQVLLGTLPLGILGTAVVDLWMEPAALASSGALSVTILPTAVPPPETESLPTVWRWTQALGLVTVAAGVLALIRLTQLGLGATATLRLRLALDDTAPSWALQVKTRRLAARHGVDRPVRVCTTDMAPVPVTLGGWWPAILLPSSLRDEPEALRMTIAHELVHLRRYDDVAQFLERLLAAVFAAHPLVTRLRQAIESAREHACDAAVLADDRTSPGTYARLLVEFADGTSPRRLGALTLSESPSSLTNRLRTMRTSISRERSSLFNRAVSLLVLGFVLVSGMAACSDSVAPNDRDDPDRPEAAAKGDASEGVYTEVEQQPDCGGVQALTEKIQYPDVARESGIEGRVLVQFVVRENGTVTESTVTKGVHDALDEAALSAVQTLDCEPGRQDGKAVPVQMAIPVTFKLPEESASSASSSSSSEPALAIRYARDSRESKPPAGPVFSGTTLAALRSGIDDPKLVEKAGIEGTVEVTFRLTESGEARNPKVSESVHEALDAKVLRSVRNTTFDVRENQAVNLAGERVRVRFTYQLPNT